MDEIRLTIASRVLASLIHGHMNPGNSGIVIDPDSLRGLSKMALIAADQLLVSANAMPVPAGVQMPTESTSEARR